uniref:Uncharacterized protein n=1 Tax=Mustela putorius furo TaxID=9669 RepID=M3YNA9_MUSPF
MKIKPRSQALAGFLGGGGGGGGGGGQRSPHSSPTPCGGDRMADTTVPAPSSGEQPGLRGGPLPTPGDPHFLHQPPGLRQESPRLATCPAFHMREGAGKAEVISASSETWSRSTCGREACLTHSCASVPSWCQLRPVVTGSLPGAPAAHQPQWTGVSRASLSGR